MVMTVMALLAPSAPIGIGVVGRVVIQVSDGQDHPWADDGKRSAPAGHRGQPARSAVGRTPECRRQAKWGDHTAEKLALAKGRIDEAAPRWPGLKNDLNATGLGSDPKLIQQLVARAERRPEQERYAAGAKLNAAKAGLRGTSASTPSMSVSVSHRGLHRCLWRCRHRGLPWCRHRYLIHQSQPRTHPGVHQREGRQRSGPLDPVCNLMGDRVLDRLNVRYPPDGPSLGRRALDFHRNVDLHDRTLPLRLFDR
jgi:hypothetical protein